MLSAGLDLPERTTKPRRSGLSVVIDTGMPTGAFIDAISSAADLVDLVKLGWGTALVTADLDRKLAALRDLGIGWYLGGTLLEKYVLAGQVDRYRQLVDSLGCAAVEVSNGTIDLSNEEKCRLVTLLSRDCPVISEVGFKSAERSGALEPEVWAAWCRDDVEAGAMLVTLEARESGRSGICRPDGSMRRDVLDAVVQSGVDLDRLVFEAPTVAQQAEVVRALGPNVNVANVKPEGVIGLETLRLGLRSDTLFAFPRAAGALARTRA